MILTNIFLLFFFFLLFRSGRRSASSWTWRTITWRSSVATSFSVSRSAGFPTNNCTRRYRPFTAIPKWLWCTSANRWTDDDSCGRDFLSFYGKTPQDFNAKLLGISFEFMFCATGTISLYFFMERFQTSTPLLGISFIVWISVLCTWNSLDRWQHGWLWGNILSFFERFHTTSTTPLPSIGIGWIYVPHTLLTVKWTTAFVIVGIMFCNPTNHNATFTRGSFVLNSIHVLCIWMYSCCHLCEVLFLEESTHNSSWIYNTSTYLQIWYYVLNVPCAWTAPFFHLCNSAITLQSAWQPTKCDVDSFYPFPVLGWLIFNILL